MSKPVEITILGDGAFAGGSANIVDYSAQEDATPLDLTNPMGGVGSVSFDVLEEEGPDGSILLPGQPFRLSDPYAGATHGVIDGGEVVNDGVMSVRASGMLLPLVSTRHMPAMTGTVASVLSAWFTACGMVDTSFRIDSAVASLPVTTPSWKGDTWTQIKKLAIIYGFEIAEVDGTVVVRKLRQRWVDVQRYTSKRRSYGRTDASQTVEVYYYNNRWAANEQVYPNNETEVIERSIISVDAGEESVTNVAVDMWISSIDAPEQTLTLPLDAGPVLSSVYSVVDKDGRPVSVADWRNGGGMVKFDIGADGRSIDITVRGMSTNSRAPYRIASSSADMEYQYAALYIAATGVAFKREMIWSPSGADLHDAPVDEVTTIDDPMVSTLEQAQAIRSRAVVSACGLEQTFEVSASHVNRRGETGVAVGVTFESFNADNAGKTFSAFDAQQGSKTFKTFSAEQDASMATLFANQAFGGIGGARVRDGDAIYRIASASIQPGEFSWRAESDVLFSDHAAVQPTVTFAQFDALWAGKTFEQHYRMPLRV